MLTAKRRVTCSEGTKSVVTTIHFSWWPTRPSNRKFASISPDSPGAYTVFGKDAVVHPHDGRTSVILTGAGPTLVNRNLARVNLSSGFALRVCSGFSHFNWPNTGVASATRRNAVTFIA